MKKLNLIISGLALGVVVPAVAIAAPFQPVTQPTANDTAVTASPVYKVGSQYSYKGVNYTPTATNHYDEVGIASWYGDQFNGKLTSNGEVFNKELATAASATLALPSIVEITNLDNGKKLIVRVNDRGPYTNSNRLIDVSERAAELLGFKDKGTARVRVTLLPDLSKMAAEQMPNYKDVMASNNTGAKVVPVNATAAATPANISNMNPVLASNTTADSGLIPNSQLASSDSTDATATPKPAAVQVDENNLKQVSLQEPNTIQQYVPRGVFVQVGAFDSGNSNIKSAITSLSKVGVVTLQNIDLEGKNVLRVRVGPYGSIDDAAKVKTALVKLGYHDPRVVVEE
ncbi:septal ring lytic transglycosylase RlpA family protein [Rickettsiales bacterium LUAb2]